MSAQDNQPNWDEIAEKFDLWLPQLAPVGEALIEALDAQPGDHILDLACGTGEPALTLAKRAPHSHIIATDAAPAMIKVAEKKAAQQQLKNIEFQTMPAEALSFADASFDRALCRFGVMLFEDPLKGLKEMRRVLNKGGRFAFAVWSTPETMTTLHWASQVFKDKIPEKYQPPSAKVSSLGAPGVLEQLLADADLNHHKIETKRFDYRFQSFDEYWQTIEASDIMKQQFDALPESERATVRDEIARFARDFHSTDGLRIPHEYLLVSGQR